MPEVSGQQRSPDAPTLRRIALLVMRASEDNAALRAPLAEIRNVIDHMKKDVAMGQPFGRDDVVRLGSLIDKLATKPRGHTVQKAILTELRDLGHTLCARISD